MSHQEAPEVLTKFKQWLAARQEAMRKEEGAKNLKEEEEFLQTNAKKAGVVSLPSGLQYQVLKPGYGKMPTKEGTVTVDYKGTLVDGTEFDSSYKRGRPATFAVSGVIPGWTEALQLMQEGALYRLFIPARLAYGERGAGPIGPNATLIFEVELKKVE
jgi:FKBP-type peptidyl-prolyl cis-trans isomerase FklB